MRSPALAGCGETESSSSEPTAGEGDSPAQIKAAVERVWTDVYDASRAGDGARVCSHATARYARRLIAVSGGNSCAQAASRAGKVGRDFVPAGVRPRYSSFATHADRASILVTLRTGGEALRNRVRFRLVDRAWKLDGDSAVDQT
jgi:hypothetical protein